MKIYDINIFLKYFQQNIIKYKQLFTFNIFRDPDVDCRCGKYQTCHVLYMEKFNSELTFVPCVNDFHHTVNEYSLNNKNFVVVSKLLYSLNIKTTLNI